MPLKILHDKEKQLSCLYDEIEMKPVGILFSEDESISDFLEWYSENPIIDIDELKREEEIKLEHLGEDEFKRKVDEWRSMYRNTQTT